ncbi:MAG: sigma-54 dependent transcriptional regulator [Gemmataceae bacterium]
MIALPPCLLATILITMPSKALSTVPVDSSLEPLRVLVVDDDRLHAETVAEVLQKVGHDVTTETSGMSGAKALDRDDFDVVLTDLRMADLDGLAIVRKVRSEQPDAAVIVITGFAEVKTAVEAVKLGAAHYLVKPVDMAELRAVVATAGERPRLTRANRELRRQIDDRFGFEGVIGNSPKMHEVIARLRAYAPTRATVLIRGDSGTGKELAAKALHANGPRKAKPFVAMNCTALNENLLDDELFGHEPGAFTGADRRRLGRFEHANGGTLFLDEVGDMPLALQAKLLRVLENGEVLRIGSNDPIKVDVRLISATNRDLEADIVAGRFRQDLYYRLKVGMVRMPALRERREDIRLLTEHFIKELSARHDKHVTGLSERLNSAFAVYDWPGNVRELRNAVESMVVQDLDGKLDVDDLAESEPLRQLAEPGFGIRSSGADQLVGKPLAEVERYYLERALDLCDGNREDAAKMLGIGERTLYRCIQDWKLQDKVRQAIADAGNDRAVAAEALGLSAPALDRKIKKWGWR